MYNLAPAAANRLHFGLLNGSIHTMKRVILIHGLKRSGNHAVINWLRPHDHFVFFNNVVPIKPILTGEKPLPEPLPFNAWVRQRLRAKYLHAFVPLQALAIKNRPLITSLEDHELTYCPFQNPDCTVTNMLIIRDAKNVFASRIRKGMSRNSPAYPNKPGPMMQRSVDLWKSHAREFLGQTQLLENKVCVSFNEWFLNKVYRRKLSEQLGLPFTDEGVSQVSAKGGGSSFNSTQFDGNSQNMQVLNRYESLEGPEKELFDVVFMDNELRELNDRIEATVTQKNDK